MSPEDSGKKPKHAKKLSIIIDEEIEMKGGDINSPALHSNKSKPTNPAKSSEFKNGMVNQLDASYVSKVSINDVASGYSKYLDKKNNALKTS